MHPPAPSNTRGIAFMCTAMLLFMLNDVCVKIAARDLPATQIMALRGIVVVAMFLIAVRIAGQWHALPRLAQPLVALRALLEAAVALLYITALSRMGIAELTAIFLVAPLMMTAASALILKESVGWRRWSAVVVGFFGAMLIVKPSPVGLEWSALFGLGSAALAVARDLVTRKLDPATPSLVVSLGTGLGVALAGGAAGFLDIWPVPSANLIFLLVAAALIVGAGNYAIIVAFRSAEVSAVAPFRYLLIVFALIAGFAVFGERPDPLSIYGMLLIGGSGLYVVHRERVRARAALLTRGR